MLYEVSSESACNYAKQSQKGWGRKWKFMLKGLYIVHEVVYYDFKADWGKLRVHIGIPGANSKNVTQYIVAKNPMEETSLVGQWLRL